MMQYRTCTCLARSTLRSSSSSATLPRRALSTSPRVFADASTSTAKPAFSPASALPESSCPAGTVLKGLSYLKDASDPVALESTEYPDWIWNLTTQPKVVKGKKAAAAADEQEKSLKDRIRAQRKEGKKAIKAQNTLKG
ncbi:ribosomal protein L37, mitochondrial [Pseudohyphozyma bogoriensis]|nr:ribosomal protein L37, mitochondrial [Pseudohyphozyma bogoriensis]